MKIFDIHSHILPGVDDGPTEIETSLQLLSSMKEQGITDVIATPHFFATHENLEEYISKVNSAYTLLKEESKHKDLPNIYLCSEVFYFSGMGKINSVKSLSLCNSKYILLELPFCPITDNIINALTACFFLSITSESSSCFKIFLKSNKSPVNITMSAFNSLRALTTFFNVSSTEVWTFSIESQIVWISFLYSKYVTRDISS